MRLLSGVATLEPPILLWVIPINLFVTKLGLNIILSFVCRWLFILGWRGFSFSLSSSTSPQETHHNVKPGGKNGKNDVEERSGHQNQRGFLRTIEWEKGSRRQCRKDNQVYPELGAHGMTVRKLNEGWSRRESGDRPLKLTNIQIYKWVLLKVPYLRETLCFSVNNLMVKIRSLFTKSVAEHFIVPSAVPFILN